MFIYKIYIITVHHILESTMADTMSSAPAPAPIPVPTSAPVPPYQKIQSILDFFRNDVPLTGLTLENITKMIGLGIDLGISERNMEIVIDLYKKFQEIPTQEGRDMALDFLESIASANINSKSDAEQMLKVSTLFAAMTPQQREDIAQKLDSTDPTSAGLLRKLSSELNQSSNALDSTFDKKKKSSMFNFDNTYHEINNTIFYPSNVKPQVSQNVKPQVSQNVKPDVKPQVSQNVKPQVSQNVKPQVSQNVKPDVKPQVSQHVKPDVKPQVGQVNQKDNDIDEQLKTFVLVELNDDQVQPQKKNTYDEECEEIDVEQYEEINVE